MESGKLFWWIINNNIYKHTVSGVGTVATISTSQVTKVVVKIDTTTGSSISTVSNPVTVDAASTLSGVSTSVGIVTTTSTDEYQVLQLLQQPQLTQHLILTLM